MPLDPQAEFVLSQIPQDVPKLHEMSPSEARAAFEAMAPPLPAEDVARVADRAIPGVSGEMSLRVYWPEGATDGGAPVLVYPVTDHDFETRSYTANAEGYLLERDAMRWFWDQYVPNARPSAFDPHRNPGMAGNREAERPVGKEGSSHSGFQLTPRRADAMPNARRIAMTLRRCHQPESANGSSALHPPTSTRFHHGCRAVVRGCVASESAARRGGHQPQASG
jgi:hypothetical protein